MAADQVFQDLTSTEQDKTKTPVAAVAAVGVDDIPVKTKQVEQNTKVKKNAAPAKQKLGEKRKVVAQDNGKETIVNATLAAADLLYRPRPQNQEAPAPKRNRPSVESGSEQEEEEISGGEEEEEESGSETGGESGGDKRPSRPRNPNAPCNKPAPCDYCGKILSNAYNKRRHTRQCHAPEIEVENAFCAGDIPNYPQLLSVAYMYAFAPGQIGLFTYPAGK